MNQAEIKKIWKGSLIPQASKMVREGKNLSQIALGLGVKYGMLRIYFNRFSSVDYAKMVSKGRHLKYLPYVEMQEEGKTIKEISKYFDVTSERVRQILELFGIRGNLHNDRPYYKVDSDVMFENELLNKRKAFRLGLSIAEYEKYVQKVPKDIRASISSKFWSISRNESIVTTLQEGLSLMQLSALEILEMYLERARDCYPDEDALSSVRRMLVPKSGYAVMRKDFSLPYLPENSFVATKSEFGSLWGKQFGAHSDYQQKRKMEV